MAANSVLEDAKQHGLGLGLDITNDDPWRNRSSFNARRNATPDDILEVREEGVAEYLKVSNVEDKSFIFEANASLGALHQAKSVVMKVGFSREVYNSQKLEVTTVRTRTVSFEVNPGDKRETSFERELCDKINFEDDQSMETLLKACAGFVDTYKITHYTAAITLGAMEYTVHNKQATQSSSKLSAGAGDHVSATASAENNKRAEGTYTSTAGTLADKSVKKEAVILIEMKPIHTLVRKPNLARALENAIAIYCLEKMPQRKFHIFFNLQPVAGWLLCMFVITL